MEIQGKSILVRGSMRFELARVSSYWESTVLFTEGPNPPLHLGRSCTSQDLGQGVVQGIFLTHNQPFFFPVKCSNGKGRVQRKSVLQPAIRASCN